MRSRTEMVTTQLEGSDFDDESDFEDSEEDWQPAKGEQKPKKLKSPGRATAKKSSPASGKNGAKKRGRKPAARKPSKKKPSSDEDEPEVSGDEEEAEDFSEPEPVPSPPKKVKGSPKKLPAEVDGGQTSVAAVSAIKEEPTTSSSSPASKPVPLQRKVVTQLKSFPDKFGFLNLYIFKGDLKEGIINNPQVCLWRRDGSSLLQKYLRDKTIDTDLPQFNSSMVYSCWEDRRANEYIEVKVRCIEQSKQVRVELTNVDELEAQSQAEYESYVAEHGVPEQRSSNAGNSQDGTEDDDEAYEQDEEDEEAAESEAEEE